MKKINNLRNFVVLIPLILLSACSVVYKPVTFGEIKKVKALNMDLDDLRMIMTFEVENPNFYAVEIIDFEFEIWLNEMYIGKVRPVRNFSIGSHKKGIAEIPVRAKFEGDIFEGFVTMLEVFKQNKTQYRARGEVTVKAMFLKKKVKINKTGTSVVTR
ncbi:MAG: LEA type 2 family protein [Bacteroidota bacterium]|nr:LEA type 2 family protein [Bacteroidota bacterium]